MTRSAVGEAMSRLRTSPTYARLDPACAFDGLFVPTRGAKRGRLLVEPRRFGNVEIGFQGFEQLGADDQSILLALTAQLGIEHRAIDSNSKGEIGAELRNTLALSRDDGSPLATKRVTLRNLLIDAGYHPDTSTTRAMQSLNRLRATQIREIDHATGWDRACNLISIAINHLTQEIYVAANPRLTAAVFHGQHVRVSLSERHELETDVAKILHCWLCSNVRLGQTLGNGNGAHLDTLAPHIWGTAWDCLSRQSRSQKRGLLRDGLDEINDKTCERWGNGGWAIEQTSSGLIMISRPVRLPAL